MHAPGGAGLGFHAADALVRRSSGCKTCQLALEHGSFATRMCMSNCIQTGATGERALVCLTGGHAQLQAAPGQRTSRFHSRNVGTPLLHVQARILVHSHAGWAHLLRQAEVGQAVGCEAHRPEAPRAAAALGEQQALQPLCRHLHRVRTGSAAGGWGVQEQSRGGAVAAPLGQG